LNNHYENNKGKLLGWTRKFGETYHSGRIIARQAVYKFPFGEIRGFSLVYASQGCAEGHVILKAFPDWSGGVISAIIHAQHMLPLLQRLDSSVDGRCHHVYYGEAGVCQALHLSG
jgi:hypothetical protein